MLLQNLALKKGKEVAAHNIHSLTKCGNCLSQSNDKRRTYTSNQSAASRVREELAKETCEKLSTQHQAKKKAKAIDRDFFLSVLGSSATKREARSYIQNFKPPNTAPPKLKIEESTQQKSTENGANLGSIYTATRAVAESPKFVQQPVLPKPAPEGPLLHVALVKIRAPQLLDDGTLGGIGKTLSRLSRLGLVSTVVVDCDDGSDTLLKISKREWRNMVKEQAARVVAAIDASGTEARLVDNVIGIAEDGSNFEQQPYLKGRVHVTLRELLMTPLRRGVLPVIPSIGHTDTTQTVVSATANDVVLALTREFAGLWSSQSLDEHPNVVKERLQALRSEVSLDRLILVDPLGGIPASDRKNGYHVFLNMEQEYELAKQDLINRGGMYSETSQKPTLPEASPKSRIGDAIPLSSFTETKPGELENSLPLQNGSPAKQDPRMRFHLENLELVRSTLALLPPSSSALITTPDEAANSEKQPEFKAAGVGTRRQRNPLIHNLLTDKPAFSSSLPVGRLGPMDKNEPISSSTKFAPTTFAKHGMPVTIFPDPKTTPWQPPIAGVPQISLTDPQIDLPRLVHLIEDSFNKKLDVQHYLRRVNNRVAGVIIAGEYEGGALLTWELPPGVFDDGSEESRKRMVPYLDKFAVLKKSQGSGGVADVVFKSMVRDCFPSGVCWRSRKDNPVNKWYFERSRATLKLSDTNWTMFFTTPEENMGHQTFKDYEAVCKAWRAFGNLEVWYTRYMTGPEWIGGAEGELTLARGANAAGIVHCFATPSSYTHTEVLNETKRQAFFQLYVNKDRAKSEAAIRTIEASGKVKAILLTVDVPVIPKREDDERVKSQEQLAVSGIGTNFETETSDKKGAGFARQAASFIDPTTSWDDLKWLRSITQLPIVIKGIQTAADAMMAAKMGVQGIVISNHGGRAADTAPPSILVLLELQKQCPEIFAQLEVLIDGGFRRGSDIVKAICLGASAVGMGRPFLYSLSYGQEGVEHAAWILKEEIETAMRLCGMTDLMRDAHPDLVNTSSLDFMVPGLRHPYARKVDKSAGWLSSLRSKL